MKTKITDNTFVLFTDIAHAFLNWELSACVAAYEMKQKIYPNVRKQANTFEDKILFNLSILWRIVVWLKSYRKSFELNDYACAIAFLFVFAIFKVYFF